MKKHVHRHNRRRKKTVAQRKAARVRCVAAMHPGDMAFFQRLDERQYLIDALQPFHEAIVRAMAPHFHDVFEGEDPADDPDLVPYAVDLLQDAGLATIAIHDIYRDGAEAGLRHAERAIEWYRAFDADRRQAMTLAEPSR
jgi:hypothetical protein